MAGDSLLDLIAIARDTLPEIPDADWQRFEAAVRGEFGACRIYIARQQKRALLQAIDADPSADPAAVARALGVSVRRVQQLRKLCSSP